MEEEKPQLSKKLLLESEDSSYDSDYEASDHYDVSRTVSDKSDTLATEFEEYVTTIEGSSTFSQNALTNCDSKDYSMHQSRVDFARKLGYSEEQVQIALSKLGCSPSQNELLAELIQLDCSTPSRASETITAENSGDTTPTVKQIVLRHIVIDGSNVAMSHGNNKTFSCKGIQLAVDYFRQRGHKEITVFVPSFRKETPKPDDPVTDQHILTELEKEELLVFTPSRTVGNRRLVCYDDRYILRLAVDTDGVVVSNDNYRDLTIESPEFKKVTQERMLMYSFVNNRFMPPEDPLGRNGPTLDQFLSKTPLKSAPPCPYGRKCTYGVKCKYFHPIIKQSVSENLRKQAALKITQSLPLSTSKLTPISRTKSAVPLGNAAQNQANPHKKLQRQLSINPVSDPRVGSYGVNLLGQASSSSSSGSSNSMTYLSPFPTQPGLSAVWSPPNQTPPQYDEQHQRIYYHLAAIFPSHQVTHVMNLYPDERDPQVLCKHIIKLFN